MTEKRRKRLKRAARRRRFKRFIIAAAVVILGTCGYRLRNSMSEEKRQVLETDLEEETEISLFGKTIAAEEFSSLTINEANVLETVSAYFDAKSRQDETAMQRIDPQADTQSVLYYLNSAGITSYQNIITWSREGNEEGSYFVFAAYEVVAEGVDTPIPSLSWMYLSGTEDGKLCLLDISEDAGAQELAEGIRQSEEGQKLISLAKEAYMQALESDTELSEYMEKFET
ncbi:MAG: hypothetical protein Q4C50_12385 [Eubacteriales bacterium]|nr:hypothetical protein [Eubacteriales bacterium]